ncbi:MAG TPA: helix-turn-helix transcriptional regulator [Ktedonobacteraceae bacterium]
MNSGKAIQRNEHLRQERIRHNWRQREVADQLGTTVVTVRRWEQGR